MTAPGYRLDEAALEVAYKAYLDCPIDMCGDHDEECEKTVRAAIVAYLEAAAPQPEPPADLVKLATDAYDEWVEDAGRRPQTTGEFIAGLMQEHAAAEKSRADKAEKALADERERCAKIADEYGCPQTVSDKIRGIDSEAP